MLSKTNNHWDNYYSQDKDFSLMSSRALSRILKYTDSKLPKVCLDIGCGTGQLTRELYHRGYKCLGIDVSTKAIEIAQSLTVRKGLEYRQFDIETDNLANLPPESYSLITCKLVCAFIKDKIAFLKRANNLLAKGGTFVILTPLLEDMSKEKLSIAVDYETLKEVRIVFQDVQTIKEPGFTMFICR